VKKLMRDAFRWGKSDVDTVGVEEKAIGRKKGIFQSTKNQVHHDLPVNKNQDHDDLRKSGVNIY
jgi:hypothetical protein